MGVNINSLSSLRANLQSHRNKLKHHDRKRKSYPLGHPERAVRWARVQREIWFIKRRKKQIAALEAKRPKAPPIVGLGINPRGKWGSLGTVRGVIGHYTAGPRARSRAHAIELLRSYDRAHDALWGDGLGYHLGIGPDGSILLGRPLSMTGAHTQGRNTGYIGIVIPGTVGHKPNAAEAETLRWLAANAHTTAMPASHRSPVKLANVRWYGHNDFNATQCPGGFKRVFTSKGQKR